MYFLKRRTEAKTIACCLMKHFRLNTWADETSANAIFAGVKGLNFKQMKKKNGTRDKCGCSLVEN